MKRVFSAIFAIGAGLFMLVSCTTPASELDGKWRIVEVDGEAITSDKPYLEFNPADSTVAGYLGCNRTFGRCLFSAEDPRAISFSRMGMTMMMCPEMELEDRISAALHAVVSCDYPAAGKLRLLDAEKKSVLLLQKEESKEK